MWLRKKNKQWIFFKESFRCSKHQGKNINTEEKCQFFLKKGKPQTKENTYLALYGESGTWVFASIDVSYSFALKRKK